MFNSDYTLQFLVPTGGAGLLRSSERPRESHRVCVWEGEGSCQGLEKLRILKRPQVSALKEMGLLQAGQGGEKTDL